MRSKPAVSHRVAVAGVLAATILLAAPLAGTGPPCLDGIDNDLDGAIDFPADPGCHAANDTDETDVGEPAVVEPRVLVLLASAGTLNGNTCAGEFTGGDGSVECSGSDVACDLCASATCGNGIPDDSRLAAIRVAIERLARRGDVQLALMRADQSGVTFACPTSSPLSASGGWQGAAAACSGGLDAGELLVAFAHQNWPALAGYLNQDDDWFEAGTPTAGLDLEVRASGDRPLGTLLGTAGQYLESVRSADPQQSCRPYRVVLIADGGEGCGGDAAAAAQDLFAGAGVPVHVVGFATTDSTVIDELDAVAEAGGTGQAVLADGSSELGAAVDAIAGDSTLVELCNQIDDDCDLLVDESFPRLGDACDNGLTGACRRTGTLACSGSGLGTVCLTEPASGGDELCNGVDDDCDGATDEGGVCVAGSELCNGIDDDGDQTIDEGFPVGEACEEGTGACRAAGLFACRPDHLGVRCVPTVPPPVAAGVDGTCDGIDDDCDGEIDEEAFDEMVAVTFEATTVWIDRFEASRPDASEFDPGWRDHRACSKPGMLPWAGLTQPEAAAACAAAGKRLCTEAEWQAACAGPSGFAYPYGNVFAADSCNGTDFDPDCTSPDDDEPLATATPIGCPAPVSSECVSAPGAFDLSGNLAEWTSTAAGASDFRVRGGAFHSPEPALRCDDDTVARTGDSPAPSIGFRCCADEAPLPPWIFEDGFENGTTPWSATVPS